MTDKIRLVKVGSSATRELSDEEGDDIDKEKTGAKKTSSSTSRSRRELPPVEDIEQGASGGRVKSRSPKKKRKRPRKSEEESREGSDASDVPLATQETMMISEEANGLVAQVNHNGTVKETTEWKSEHPDDENPNFNRYVSETPSWIELKKWKKQMEAAQLMHLSLHQLARDGDVKRMRELLDSCPNLTVMLQRINQFDEDRLTPLHYAARYSNFPVVKLLVERGADVNIQGEEGITPLHFAARYKRMKSATVTLRPQTSESLRRTRSWDGGTTKRKVQIVTSSGTSRKRSEGKMRKGSVVSVMSVEEDNLETESTITFLVAGGANPNVQDQYGLTPLHFAAMRQNVVVAQELLKCEGILVDAEDHQLMTPLHAACSHGSIEVARLLLLQGANILAKDETLNTPLHLAAQEGHSHIVKMLFEFVLQSCKGGGEAQEKLMGMMKATDYEGSTPLLLAVDNGNYEIARFLLEKGADVNTHRVMHNTALHVACVSGDIRIVELLVEHGAKIDSRNADQATPLHKVSAYSHSQIVEYLIDHGANVEATDKDGFTPLLNAACEDHAKSIVCLIRRMARVDATDKQDRTALYLAAEFNNLASLDALLKNSEKIFELMDKPNRYMNTPLHVAACSGYIDIVKCLLDNGAQIDSKNEEEKTPMHLAAEEGRTRIVRELVRRSKLIVADEDEDSNTPLHVAAIKGHEMVCRELIDAGADIAARNARLWTPLDCAAANGWERTSAVLLENDAPVDPVDKARVTPLHLASSHGHLEVVKLLLKKGASVGLVDHKDYNCLDHAIENNHKEVALAILGDPRWKDAMRNSRDVLDHAGDMKRVTPLRQLIKRLPDVAEEVFNKCTIPQGHPERKGYSITFKYEFLDDTYADWQFHPGDSVDSVSRSFATKQNPHRRQFDENGKLLEDAQPYDKSADTVTRNHPLNIMVMSEREQLLGHPLVISLLRHKWNSYGRHVYYAALLLYILYLFFLTGFIVMTDPPFLLMLNGSGDPIGGKSFDDLCDQNTEIKQKPFAVVAKFVVLGLTVFHILKEVFQIVQRKIHYLSWENCIEWFVYVSAFLLVVDFSKCTERTGIRYPWQWQIGAAAIFLAWMNLVLFIRKFPRFGIYVVMFTDILRTFSRFFVVFLLFVVAFALGFFTLFQNQFPFRDVGHSMIKTVVMMIGEFEFDDIFNELNPDSEQKVFYPAVGYALFCAFIILMTLLIMNLLVRKKIGLAVDDIKAVQEKAVLKKLAMQVELVLHIEQIMPEWLRRHWIVGKVTIKPNQGRHYRSFKKMLFGSPTQLSVTTIAKQLNREQDEIEQIKQVQESMSTRLDQMRRRVESMENQQDRLHSMMHAVLQHFSIQWEDQDEF